MSIMNWICLISVGGLVLQLMIYFCQDAISELEYTKKTNEQSRRKVVKVTPAYREKHYLEKVAE